MKPGVVFGDSYIELMEAAREGGYALPAVNVTGTDTANAVLEAARDASSDVIVQVSNGGASFFGGASLGNEARVPGALSLADHVIRMAPLYGICVVLHTDHANRALLPWVEGMLDAAEARVRAGGIPYFSSHMVDLSSESLGDNLKVVSQLMKKARPLGVSIEMEVGITGGEEDGVGRDVKPGETERLYTKPEEVLRIYRELSPLGYFTLAAAFGNVHGVYKPGNVVLRPEILRDSQRKVAEVMGRKGNPVPFVFHGGSGSEPDAIARAVAYGVVKMNIDTDTQFVFSRGCYETMSKTPRAFEVQVEEDGTLYKKNYDPRVWLRGGQRALVERLSQSFDLLGSRGRTRAV